MAASIRKSAPYRKSLALLKQVPRAYKRYLSTRADYLSTPPVLANSFPKSGTHLLLQVAESLPYAQNYGTFIATMPSTVFRARTKSGQEKLIDRLAPGECAAAHLFFDATFDEALVQKNCVHFFIFRDPRDVAVSEAYYLTTMTRWHRMSRYFRELESWEERISRSIVGFPPSFPYDFPNVSDRFSNYSGWLDSPNVCSMRYEELNSPRRRDCLSKMAEFYSQHCTPALDVEAMVVAMEASIDPSKSHTFREGGIGKWRQVFTHLHKKQMKDVAGELLIKLGYEDDLDW